VGREDLGYRRMVKRMKGGLDVQPQWEILHRSDFWRNVESLKSLQWTVHRSQNRNVTPLGWFPPSTHPRKHAPPKKKTLEKREEG